MNFTKTNAQESLKSTIHGSLSTNSRRLVRFNILFTQEFITKVNEFALQNATPDANGDLNASVNTIMDQLILFWLGGVNVSNLVYPEEILRPEDYIDKMNPNEDVIMMEAGKFTTYKTTFARASSCENIGFMSVVRMRTIDPNFISVYKGNTPQEDIDKLLKRACFVILHKEGRYKLPVIKQIIPVSNDNKYYYSGV